jgi:hypothetical protein
MSVCLYVCMSVCLYVCMSVCVSPCVYVQLCSHFWVVELTNKAINSKAVLLIGLIGLFADSGESPVGIAVCVPVRPPIRRWTTKQRS